MKRRVNENRKQGKEGKLKEENLKEKMEDETYKVKKKKKRETSH